MMKPLLQSALFFYLLIVLVNVAGAEDAALKTQTSTNISSSAVVAKDEAVSSKTVVVGNKNTKRYHLPGMPNYNKVEKYHRVYFDSEQQAIANGYYKAGTGKDLTGRVRQVVGNKDTKRYHLPGMPNYNKVEKYHRIYFDSEQQAIDNGYYKAGTGKDVTGRVSPAGGETIKNQTTPIAAALAGSEKSSQESLQKNEKILETRAQDTPKTVEEPPELSGENIQKKTVNKEMIIDAPVKPPSPVVSITDNAVEPKVQLDQKNNMANAQGGVFLKREDNTLQLDKITLNKERPRRIEASYSFNYLHPQDPYGDWHSGQLAFYDTVSPDFTYFLQGAAFNRKEGNGATGTVGAYKGWTSFLYTCTSVTAGTHSTYLPEFRVDHDFNFAVWPGKNINFLTGISYIDYFSDQSGWIFSGGPMITIEKWILHYRLFYNINNPGAISSFSHLISLGYGQEGWQWTYLNVSFGKQDYLAAYASLQEVNENSLSLNLRHRHWLGKHYGIFGDLSYTKLEDGYDMYGIGLGVFYEF